MDQSNADNNNSTTIFNEGLFLVQTTLLLIFSLWSCLANVLTIVMLFSSSFAHPNVNLLLLSVGLGNILQSMHYIGQCIYTYIFFYAADIADILSVSPMICARFQLLNSIAVNVVLLSMVAMVGERLLAVTIHKSAISTDSDRSDKVARLLTCVSWLLSLAMCMPLLFIAKTNDSRLSYCHSVLISDTTTFLILLCVSLSLETFNISAGLIVRKISTKKLFNRITVANNNNQQHQSLTERFQLNRNVVTMSMVYPSALCHFVCYVSALLLRLPSRADHPQFVLHFLLLNMQMLDAFNLLHPIICVHFNARLANALIRRWPKLVRYAFVIRNAQYQQAVNQTNLKPVTTLSAGINGVIALATPRHDAEKAGKSGKPLPNAGRHERRKQAYNTVNGATTEFRLAPDLQKSMLEQFWAKP